MRNKKSNNRAPLLSPMHIALGLLCAVLISAYALSGLYARYISNASSGDSARVAKFSFTDDFDEKYVDFPASFAPGESQTNTIEITNNSEVAIKYVVTFENLTNNLPLESKVGNEAFTSGVIAANGGTAIFSWTIQWPTDDSSKTSPDLAGKMDMIRIIVTVEQVD